MCGFPAGSVVKSPPAGDAVSTPVWEDPTPEKQLRPWAPTTEPALRSREPQDWARASWSPAAQQGEMPQRQKSQHSSGDPARTNWTNTTEWADWRQIHRSRPESPTARGGRRAGPRPPACGLCLDYWVICRSFVLNYKYIFAIFIRPPDHSEQTEISDRNTGTLQELPGNFFLSKQVCMGSACFSSVRKRPTYILSLSVGFKGQTDWNSSYRTTICHVEKPCCLIIPWLSMIKPTWGFWHLPPTVNCQLGSFSLKARSALSKWEYTWRQDDQG